MSDFFLGIVILADHGSNKLEAFARVQLPALVVSCKCDAPQRQINPSSIEQVGTVSGYETMQTSAASPDSQKKCVNMVLSMILRKNGLCPSLLLFLFRCTVSWRLLLCAFCLFFGKIGWRNVCFGCEYHFPYLFFFILFPASAGKGDRRRSLSLGLVEGMCLSFALSSRIDSHTLLSVWSLSRIFVNILF